MRSRNRGDAPDVADVARVTGIAGVASAAVVITGAGGAFCAGGDISGAPESRSRFHGHPMGHMLERRDGFHQLVLSLHRFDKPVIVAEYSDFARQVNDIVFNLPDGMGKVTAIWEPLSWRTNGFDRQGNVTDAVRVYDELSAEYLKSRP